MPIITEWPTFGPVRVPTMDSWYNSQQTFRPVHLSGCDVELGRDWLASVNAKYDGYRLQRPSEADFGRLSGGHGWNFQPEDNLCSPSSSVVTDREKVSPSNDQSRAAELQANFGSVVVTDVDGNVSANELRAAAIRHIKNKGGGYVQLPHDLPVTLAIDSLYGSKKRP
ncbi:hypothetical protein DFJ58DRAFT_757181 [Suillus subalutaceus]|uniref:uncharacterized protein n=1 Tax=Suillus subalutaceus TaxID=48586 RepID=UPI001B868587|nr:uncharacterized protein DFJ58DRAFT_757181 [Suillus subalutaceus]KAG1875632.1 hypothetical protein DFJ58DRAFT_757181 [Suillus subalutaceus]